MERRPPGTLRFLPLAIVLALGCASVTAADAQDPPDIGLEELLGVEVTSVSRKAERLHDVAAAVFVISREDIERSGATSIPEALRMAPGVNVASLANNRWAVSIRGFNDRWGNKLLVLMDGRSIYSPLFSGVVWEDQDTLLEDIDRIEVVRGPGAAMWGANAVNGVINIITRRARDTQGDLLVGAAGTEERALIAFRHGGEAGNGHFRVWGKAFTRDQAVTADGRSGNDYWHAERVGFRGDWVTGNGQRLMLSGQVYSSPTGDRWNLGDVNSPQGFTLTDRRQGGKGGHLLGRNDWTFADGSEAALQAYVDVSSLELESAFKEDRTTVDLDFQHRLLLGKHHDVIWGVGYRYSRDRISASGIITAQPSSRAFSLASAFVYDDITLLPNALRLMLGVRLEDSSFTGVEPLPNLRVMWTPSDSQSVWASIARAVRTPSRAELDGEIKLSVTPVGAPGNPTPLPILTRNIPDDHQLNVETVLAYELGYRQQFAANLSADVATFYNQYADLRSAMLGTQQLAFAPAAHLIQDIIPDNSIKARTSGVEVALDWYPLTWWRIQPSYSFLRLTATSKSGDPISVNNAKNINASDPQHQLSLRSSLSLSDRQQFDLWLRYVSRLGDKDSPLGVPAYTTLDLRYAWRPTRDLEVSLVGQNLLDHSHPEFVPGLLPSQQLELQRGMYVKAKWQF
ncbi:MAG: TonB-dependent receptor [Candidatus Accumulibacter sp.]|uniref:TonB-dependent receptor plug domain-containing protein n=1 Tax=Accumulibacter sp. TaxID=2053492 RepID=UPI001AD2A4DB|nr:TonB-dependent receptor [Accumulibacter sp.]MBN8439136.1 TonB-dependent receptor [Accumulibacter sp.]